MENENIYIEQMTLGQMTIRIRTLKGDAHPASSSVNSLPSAIFFEAFLSFIGIGISAPETSLGVLLNEGQKNFQFLPYQMWYPAAVLCVLMIAFNLLGDGLRDAFDPKGQR